MAFTFNWSPLTADADFYRRARDLLTKALNKSPKPPIIVDDILVSELNLGTVPPDLEILEIGDLANDRFRGIFKMCYSGNAFLTLKTRVQANPLNTYLYSKPDFTSPQPLAAASGLTIPLSITLSEIKLSAFIILVFSRQKGLTLVFRNDPLESLKVSSTFDSIQFVRDYLQRTIEQRLRDLMIDELPAIIHRLSLQLWCPDQANKDSSPPQEEEIDEKGVDPFASPPLDPVDANGNLLDPNAISEITLNGGGEAQPYFSQQSLLRLAELTDSHRTLALFTPIIRDVVFRAWSAYTDRSEAPTPAFSSITRTYSFPIVSNNKTFSDPGCPTFTCVPTRPSLVSLNSLPNLVAHGANHSARPGRKRKNRVVNLRRTRSEVASNDSTPDNRSETESVHPLSSENASFAPIPEESDASVAQPAEAFAEPCTTTIPGDGYFSPIKTEDYPTITDPPEVVASPPRREARSKVSSPVQMYPAEKSAAITPGEPLSAKDPSCGSSDTSSVILEQAFIMRMASEIARRMYDEKKRHQQGIWAEAEHPPPPAYEATIP